MTIEERPSGNGKKIYYQLIWGKGPHDKMSAGIFTYASPMTQAEKNHNKEALAILEIKRSQLVLDRQAVGTGYYRRTVTNIISSISLKSMQRTIREREKGTCRTASTISKFLSKRSRWHPLK